VSGSPQTKAKSQESGCPVARFLTSTLVISSVFSLAAAAQAGDKHHGGNSGSQGKQQNQFNFGSWGGVSQVVSGFQHHHGHKQEPKQPIPLDPGRGDGRVPTKPTPTTPPDIRDHRDGATSQGGGFVFVDGHWERVKAAPKTSSPYRPGTIIRDHRPVDTASAPGGTVVTTTPAPRNDGPVIRDHRTPPVIIRDHRQATGSAPTGTIIRDHRPADTSNAPGGTVITTTPVLNNNGPVIRDHRTTPVVRDHRTGQ
jgi:hypothetical protein